MVFLSNGCYVIVDSRSVSVYVFSWQAYILYVDAAVDGAVWPYHHSPY